MTSRTDVVAHEGELRPITVATLQSRVALVHQALKTVMQDGTHYGTIPGTNRASLYKAGSEILLTMFQIAVDPEVDDLSTADEIRYRVRAIGRHQGTGVVVGTGIGEASSSEEKYCWRAAVCPEEYDATPHDRRRLKWAKGRDGNPAWSTFQVRTNPSDVANTVLKMAKKRAQIDLSLTATGASDIFTQDVGDDGDDTGTSAAPPPRQAARPQSSGGNRATEKQIAMVRKKAADAGVDDKALATHLGIAAVNEMEWRMVDPALAWLRNVKP